MFESSLAQNLGCCYGIFIYFICLSSSLTLVKAAGDATKHESPNTNAFDGAHDGCLNGPRAQG